LSIRSASRCSWRTPADEALRIGLVNKVVPVDELDGAASALAEKISESSPLVVGVGKAAFYKQ